jgi:hypothetical protein
MSISAVGSGSVAGGATYNFTNVTNSDFLKEIQSLRKQGALSPNQQVLLMVDADGGDSIPINGQPETTSQAQSDTSTHDFLANFQLQDYWIKNTPGTVGGALVDSVLQTLEAYQGKPIDGSSGSVSVKA